MNKVAKSGFIIITFCIVFIVGFFTSKIFFTKNDLKDSMHKDNVIGFIRKHDLSNSDKKILQNHVYGQWKITQRLTKLNGRELESLYDLKFNFSNQGVDVLKKTVISFEDEYINTEGEPDQYSFKNVRDLYLFGLYGGFSMLTKPIYHISYIDTNDITLCNEYLTGIIKDTKVPANIFKSKKVYEIYADTGVDINKDPAIQTHTFGDSLYADPRDKNTLYLDFCGLWMMKRDTSNYRTNGKSPY